MATNDGVTRRTLLKRTGAVAIPVAVAGCLSHKSDGIEEDESWEYVDDEADYEGWLDETESYTGTVDWTGRDEVTVRVGTGNYGYQYSPAAIRVDEGTTVVWEWTGEGGPHDVVATDERFESDNHRRAGATFEYTFEETGVCTYFCRPHEAVGMKGAVDVV